MPGGVYPSDGLGEFGRRVAELERRLAAMESGVRLRNATVDAPGQLRYRDEDGVVRWAVGDFGSGAVGIRSYDAEGDLIDPVEQAYTNDPRTVDSLVYAAEGPPLEIETLPGPSLAFLVLVSARVYQNAVGTGSAYMTTVGSGGKVYPASDANALEYADRAAAGSRPFRATRAILVTGASATVPTLVAVRFRVTDAAHPYVFDDPRLQVIPL